MTIIRTKKREFMLHKMKLHPEPFLQIKSGIKTIELRLYDEKRKLIQIGDTIEFSNISTGEALCAEVIFLHHFRSFRELYVKLPLLQCGYTMENLENAAPSDMNRYYSSELQEKYGALGIELRVK